MNEDDTTEDTRHQWQVAQDDAGQRIDQAIAGHLSHLSRSRVQKLIQNGHVTLDNRTVLPSHSLVGGETITLVEPAPETELPQPEALPLNVVHEDDDLLVIDKDAGMVVHPGRGVNTGTLVNALLARPHTLSAVGGPIRPGIVHRLDKETSGLLIVAKNDETHIALARALQDRSIVRLYRALALRKFEDDQGTIEAPIARHPGNRLKMAVRDTPDARPSRTHWRIQNRFGGITQIECKLDTGRTHQIRVHMAHVGHPLLGDELYGGTANLAIQFVAPNNTSLKSMIKNIKRQMLHAHEIHFTHPRSGQAMKFQSEPPRDYQVILKALQASVEGEG